MKNYSEECLISIQINSFLVALCLWRENFSIFQKGADFMKLFQKRLLKGLHKQVGRKIR